MSIEKVRAYFRTLGIEERIREFETSSATVALAAQARLLCDVDGAVCIEYSDEKFDKCIVQLFTTRCFAPT